VATETLLERLSLDLLIPVGELLYLIRSSPMRYKVYRIRKRRPGEYRTIAQPSPEVKALQYWVMEHLLCDCPTHPAATAYQKGSSIRRHVSAHCHNRFLLKLDFRDFFHSIEGADFIRFFEKQARALSAGEQEALASILFWRFRGERRLVLSIGAPSSPMVSNCLLYEFDARMGGFCEKLGVAYTRYADDLAFSSDVPNVLNLVESEVTRACEELPFPRLRLNPEKRVYTSKKRRRYLTGLVISNEGQVSLGRPRKRLISVDVHRFLLGRLDEATARKLRGTLAFVNSVEPSFLVTLRRKYGVAAMSALGFADLGG